MKISIVQIEQSVNLLQNLEKYFYYIANIEADLIVFPECSLIGYTYQSISQYKKEENYNLLKKVHNEIFNVVSKLKKTVIFGSILKENTKFYNCAFIVNKSSVKIYRKINLTEEESTLFSPGKDLLCFNLFNKKLGVLICRDQSFPELFLEHKRKGVDIIIIISAHYYKPDDLFWKRWKNIAIPIARAYDFNITLLKANSVGKLGNKISHGNSMVVNEEGKIVKMLDEFNEDIITVTI